MTQERLEYSNSTTLAYIGDAVYEVYVRNHVLKKGEIGADKLHRAAVKYVRAEAQAEALKKYMSELSEKEEILVKRARNKKISSKPKNVEPIIYKWATAFEALVGYLYLSEDKSRLEEIVDKTLKYIDGKGANYDRETGKKQV